MPGTLVIGEQRQGELRSISRELVTLGQDLTGQGSERLVVALIGPGSAELATELANEGVDEVLAVPAGGPFDAHTHQRAVEGLIDEVEPSLIVVGHTVDSMGFAPALAAKHELGFASDVTRLVLEHGQPVATRAFYGGKLAGELAFPGKDRVLIMIRAGSYAAAPPAGEPAAAVRALALELGESPSRHVDYVEVEAGDVDITAADFLVSVGRGIGDAGNLPQFEELAEAMGATLSVSRPIVDAGWISNAYQVGQSGKTVTPKVYLALGISGAVQHLAGMSGAETIIAVNTDPEAPIFGVAHYGAVADLFDVADELRELGANDVGDHR
jgi:electron transfer flavoprotein alpha subunit